MQNNKAVVLFDIDYTLFDTKNFKQSGLSQHKVYAEVMQALAELSSFATLGIFSNGETQFQKTKLEKTGILKFFKEENVHIFEDKNINLVKTLEKYKGFRVFLVDDKLEVLHLAKKNMEQVFTIWIKRGWYAENMNKVKGFKPDAEIENLSETIKIVRSNL